jgi:hypothetical protein
MERKDLLMVRALIDAFLALPEDLRAEVSRLLASGARNPTDTIRAQFMERELLPRQLALSRPRMSARRAIANRSSRRRPQSENCSRQCATILASA